MAPSVITVFGATGAQGGAVVRALSHDPACQVRAVTRNPRAESSAHLHQMKGVQVLEADLNDVNTLRSVLAGADACFLITVTYFRSGESNDEVQQGKNVADVCKELGVKHIVYSTVDPDWKEPTNVKVKELDHKIEVFSYMMSQNLPVVGVMPGFYYENILDVFEPRKVDQGVYGFSIPLEGVEWGLASVQDIGPLVHEIFTQWKEEYVGEIIPMVKEIVTLQQMCDVLNKHIQGVNFIDLQITREQVKEALKGGPNQQETVLLFDAVIKSSTDFLQQKISSRQFTTGLVSFEQWVEQNKERIQNKLST